MNMMSWCEMQCTWNSNMLGKCKCFHLRRAGNEGWTSQSHKHALGNDVEETFSSLLIALSCCGH